MNLERADQCSFCIGLYLYPSSVSMIKKLQIKVQYRKLLAVEVEYLRAMADSDVQPSLQ